MNTKFAHIIFFLFLCIPLASGSAQNSDTTKPHINYRRTGIVGSPQSTVGNETELNNNPPPTSNYQLSKEQVFPLGYGTNHLGKVTSGTGVWTEVNPGVPRVDYLGIHFVNPDTGWAVGELGAIIYTADGGQKWNTAFSPTSEVLLNVHSFNGQIVIASGYNGTIVRSTDGGANWQQIPSGVGSDLWEIKMINDTLGWACGGPDLLRTTNAGENWNLINTGYSGFNYWALDYIDENILYVAGSGGNILKTMDGGNSWQLFQTGFGKSLYRIVLFDTLRIVAGGEMGWVAFTFDGGLSWNHSQAGGEIDAMAFANDSVGYIAGYQSSHVYKTTNGGVSWEWQVASAGAYWLMFVNDTLGYNAGLNLVVKKTTNQGNSWLLTIINDDFTNVWSISENTALTTGGGVYKTTNSGFTWYPTFPYDPLDLGVASIYFTDSLTGFVGTNFNVRIYKTTDAGETWLRKNVSGVNNLSEPVYDIFFINNMIGWAVTDGGAVIKTIDGGENWTATTNSLYGLAIQFFDSLNGYVLGNGYLNRTTDGGYNWDQIDLPLVEAGDIYFNSISDGWYIPNDELYFTENSGSSWELRLTDPDIFYGKFNWVDPEKAFITGLKTYNTVDSGNTWTNISGEVGFDIKRMHSANEYSGYAIGGLGLILQYIDTSIVPVELTSFTAKQIGSDIQLIWTTASELNNSGFVLEREVEGSTYQKVSFIEGKGTSTNFNYYFYTDRNLLPLNYKYRLRQLDYDGSEHLSDEISVSVEIDSNFFEIYSNYPNPFNNSTIIEFVSGKNETIQLVVFNSLGEQVQKLFDGPVEPGKHYKIIFDASRLSSGIYYYSLTQGERKKINKMILLK